MSNVILKWSCIYCEWSGDYPDLAVIEKSLDDGRLCYLDFQCPRCHFPAIEVDPTGTLKYEWIDDDTIQLTLDARYGQALGTLLNCITDDGFLEKWWDVRTLYTWLSEIAEDAFRHNEKPWSKYHDKVKS